MNAEYWQQQTTTPLFADILWNKPENKLHAGRLLIVGGNTHGFSAPATAFSAAQKAGIGAVRIVMPIGLQKLLGHMPDTYFAPQNPSGSFSRQALDELLLHASWAEGVLLAGDLGKNSETATILETFTKKYAGQLTVTKDAVDYFLHTPLQLVTRPSTCVVLSMEQLQKIGMRTQRKEPITLGMSLASLAAWLHAFTLEFPAILVTQHTAQFVIAAGGKVVTHTPQQINKIWRVETAAKTSVFMLQHPAKPFEAVVSAFVE